MFAVVVLALGAIPDDVPFGDVNDKTVERFSEVHAVVPDSAYKTPHMNMSLQMLMRNTDYDMPDTQA